MKETPSEGHLAKRLIPHSALRNPHSDYGIKKTSPVIVAASTAAAWALSGT